MITINKIFKTCCPTTFQPSRSIELDFDDEWMLRENDELSDEQYMSLGKEFIQKILHYRDPRPDGLAIYPANKPIFNVEYMLAGPLNKELFQEGFGRSFICNEKSVSFNLEMSTYKSAGNPYAEMEEMFGPNADVFLYTSHSQVISVPQKKERYYAHTYRCAAVTESVRKQYGLEKLIEKY